MRKVLAAVAFIAGAVVVLMLAAPSAPEGVLRDVGEALRAFWGNPVTGP